VSLILFVVFVLIYQFLKKRNPYNRFVLFIDMTIEGILNFFKDLAGGIPKYAQLYIIFLFVYILWNNWIGVLIDMFANEKVVPFLHHWLRPVSSDIYFNAILAVVGVLWALWYGFKTHGFKFVEKYIPIKGMGMVQEVKGVGSFLLKIVDIIIALFIGLLEFVGEFVKILSLTLRLF
jgi:F0F1-type ATP synthase membrane subunit a